MFRELIKKFAADTFPNSTSGVISDFNGTFGGKTDAWEIVKSVINVAMTILAAVCVVMLIFAGYNYTTSAGDSGKVTKAKNTMLYAVIGLIIALLALAIVNFVLTNIIK